MQEPYFAALYESFRSGRLKASLGHRDPLLMREFFADSEEEFRSFIGHISGRACLDIGPCVSSFIAAWDTAGARYVV